MTKQEVIKDAQQYANMVQAPIYVYRRGDKYEASKREPAYFKSGWKLAETVQPVIKPHAFQESSPIGVLHDLCEAPGCKGSRTDAVHTLSLRVRCACIIPGGIQCIP